MLSNCVHLLHPQPLSIPKPLTLPSSPKFQSKTQSFPLKSSPNPSFLRLRAKNPSGCLTSFVGCSCSSSSSCSSSPEEEDFDVELGRLLALLPEEMRQRVKEHPELHQLIEVVMDLGRKNCDSGYNLGEEVDGDEAAEPAKEDGLFLGENEGFKGEVSLGLSRLGASRRSWAAGQAGEEVSGSGFAGAGLGIWGASC